MRIPSVIKCDLCGSEIALEQRVIAIAVPLPQDLRDAIIRDVEEAVKAGSAPPSVFGNLVPIASLVPPRWTLEACGCVLSLLPMLRQAVVDDVHRMLARKAALRAKADEPVDLEAL